ncbi:hypothetical protein [Rhodoluna limnophila]|uniref:hypothetical protein n=1 Tax=Rhodoluna limnophila TaxID=232537 RepID=UPI00110582EC|nr:hypothetical protein [Rhodoluna limnophila]
MKKISIKIALLLAVTVALTGCATNAPDHSYIGKAVATDFDPAVDGFSFANFNSRQYAQEFDIEDLTAMVGTRDTVCVDGVADPCVPTEGALKVIGIVNSSRQLGHCEGMVVLAAARYDLGTKVKTAELDDDPAVISAIIRSFATMFFPEVQQQTRDWVSNSLTDTVAVLAKSLETGKLEYGLGLYTPNGGHEVLPFAIEYPSKDLARVLVYDSNWPGKTRYVEIDLAAQTWRFSFSGSDQASDANAWTGTHTDLDLNSNKVRLAAIESRTGEVELPSGEIWGVE